MVEPTFVVFDEGTRLRISPPMWPNHTLEVQPGDLSKFSPQGNGVYGYEDGIDWSPFKSAPSQEACGGVVYFGNGVSKADFEALMRIMDVQPGYVVNPSKDYAAFTLESEHPGEDGYLLQMRLVSKFGLRFMFGAISESEDDQFPAQKLSAVEAMWSFIQSEKRRWGTSFSEDVKGLRGVFGGDGDFAREELAFGFTVENSYHSVYRIWSRAWLVTK